jgi:RNA polymerase sporulation-specific sigma factor
MMLKIKNFINKIFRKIFKGRNQLFYINGNDTLPPPLDPEVEEYMINNIETSEAKCALIEHNLRLVAFIAKRFENTGANIEELISIGTLGLMKAVSTFNKDKNIKLATYASR